MTRNVSLSFVLLLLAAIGCRGRIAGNFAEGVVSRVVAQPTPTVELLESELRWMEDNLYQMGDQLDLTRQELESAKRNNAVLRFELAEARKLEKSQGKSTTNRKRPTTRSTANDEPDDGDADFDEDKDLDDDDLLRIGPPDVQLGPSDNKTSGNADSDEEMGTQPPSSEEIETPQPLNATDRESGEGDDASGGDSREVELWSAPEPGPFIELAPSETLPSPFINEPLKTDEVQPNVDPSHEKAPSETNTVTRIRLNQRLTGGYNFDGVAGHEGIMVVVEPQDSSSRYVPAAGELTVEVRDPRKSDLDGRVGKWKFDAIEARQKMRRTLMGRGIHLELPWPTAPPQSERLQVLVSFQTPDGRTLKTSREIIVKPMTSALEARAAKAERTWSPYRPRPPLRSAARDPDQRQRAGWDFGR